MTNTRARRPRWLSRFCLEFSRLLCFTCRISTTSIYALHDPRPGDTHVYIGKADDPDRRLIEHRSKAKSEVTHKAYWFRQLQQLGLEPTLEVIREVPELEWEIWEMTFIQWYRALGWNVVNTTEGGEGGARVCTPETRAKIAAANKGLKRSDATRQKLRELHATRGHPMQGKHLTPETKLLLSAALKGRPKSPETRARMSASGGKHLKGKKQSPEHIAKCRAPKVGKKFTTEHKARIGAALAGKPKSAEARQRMSIAAKLRCQRNKLTAQGNSGFLPLSL